MAKKILTFFVFLFSVLIMLSFRQTPKKVNTKGKEAYALYCQSCHLEKGEGIEGLNPPLAKTTYLKDAKRAISIVLKGQTGEIVVNGKKYNSNMPAQDYLTDAQIADILSYIRSSWGNNYPAVTAAQVKAGRK